MIIRNMIFLAHSDTVSNRERKKV
uniref:Uncharacterized protein n=1 Tax=Rhizophora mucronata TaxID=61149 RepID=A0A2P2PAC9_RHIMU